MKNYRSVFLLGLLALASCDDDTVDLPDNFLTFKTTEGGLSGTEATVELSLSQAATHEVQVNLQFQASGVEYGKHFTTEPAAVNNALTLTIPQGQSNASFKVLPVSGVLLSGAETLDFTLNTVTAPTLIGINKAYKLSFAKIISSGSTLTLEAKTAESNYAQNVYVDLSANTTHLSPRKSWNLAFTNGPDFRVVLNHSLQSTAAPTTKSDIALVNLSDTATTADLYISMARLTDSKTLSLVDYWDGDLKKTAFAEVSASANKVYLVAFEGNNADKSSWYKVKVERNGNAYKVQYGKINDTNIKTVEIPKNADFNLSYLSFETGAVSQVEPKTWDIQYGYSTSNSGMNTPYWFQDFVLLNSLGGAEAAEISTLTYENYNETHLATTSFLKTRDAIGSKWRVTSGANIGITKDKFYAIKDPDGNVYKLRFLSAGIGADGGTRGKPVIEYKLVKKM